MIDFTKISYLKKGTQKQKRIYQLLSDLGIFNDLKLFTPVLVGTFPIGIDIPDSDLDILCYVEDFKHFEKILIELYSNYDHFHITQKKVNTNHTLICRFNFQGKPIEIFAQPIPVQQQNAFLHLLKKYEILQAKNKEFARSIIQLKKQGYKIEPAFAKLLNLTGNPYKSLLKYNEYGPTQ